MVGQQNEGSRVALVLLQNIKMLQNSGALSKRQRSRLKDLLIKKDPVLHSCVADYVSNRVSKQAFWQCLLELGIDQAECASSMSLSSRANPSQRSAPVESSAGSGRRSEQGNPNLKSQEEKEGEEIPEFEQNTNREYFIDMAQHQPEEQEKNSESEEENAAEPAEKQANSELHLHQAHVEDRGQDQKDGEEQEEQEEQEQEEEVEEVDEDEELEVQQEEAGEQAGDQEEQDEEYKKALMKEAVPAISEQKSAYFEPKSIVAVHPPPLPLSTTQSSSAEATAAEATAADRSSSAVRSNSEPVSTGADAVPTAGRACSLEVNEFVLVGTTGEDQISPTALATQEKAATPSKGIFESVSGWFSPSKKKKKKATASAVEQKEEDDCDWELA